ncbi:valyl-tRNA synthetase [Salmonella enterica subsp. enterica serovar Infantis str. CVM N20078]|nr:DUF551 domain-containing protein [Salmonella enterica]ETE43783.1 valyl-tRNA synthetase [Salmonella enterica subsp. enterica serovar Infantis str. 335-3]OLW57794.1 valyl-tRNA synthetase [Salmonella enterica subsp. enterica serovar Infantis str. CVM N19983]OLW66869.1 valyl-tRNA synthetase [Salmonella enterica subsp. enterica serovar Infantis str. CVM N20078]OMJ34824.1 valyl-tRNA synthetase [Salmonella enterica subsp. enterica serovar Infantis str. CVM N13139]
MTTITNNKLPEWRTALDKCVENYQSTRAWYEENRDSPAALDDMERAEDQLANFVRKCGFSIVLSLLDEIDELQELRRNYLALRGEIEDVQSQLYEAENQANEYASELQERRKADNQEPAGYHVIKECGRVGCSVATLEEAEKTRDFWNKKWTIRPYFYSAAPAPVVPEEMPAGLAGQIVSLLVHNIGDKFLAQKIWNACHAALLQGSQPVSNCDELQVIGWLRSDYNSDDKRDPNAPLFMLGRNDPSDAWGVKYIQLSGNSPVSPGGWISCSERMPDDGQHVIILCDGAFVLYAQYRDGEFFDVVRNGEEFFETHSRNVTDWMPLPEPPQEEK